MAGKKALNQQICCESDLLKTKKNIAPQSRGGRQVCAPHHTNICKSNIAVLWVIYLLSLDVSPSNLVGYLILKPSIQQC